MAAICSAVLDGGGAIKIGSWRRSRGGGLKFVRQHQEREETIWGVDDDEGGGEYRLKKEAIKHRGAQHYERPARGVRVDCGVTVEERLIRAGVYSG